LDFFGGAAFERKDGKGIHTLIRRFVEKREAIGVYVPSVLGGSVTPKKTPNTPGEIKMGRGKNPTMCLFFRNKWGGSFMYKFHHRPHYVGMIF